LGEQLAFGFTQGLSENGEESELTPGPVEVRNRSDVIHDPVIAETIDKFFRERSEELILVVDPDGESRKIPLRLLAFVDRLDRAPYSHLQYTPGRSEPVYVVSGSGEVRPAEQVSALINFLGKSRRRQARVFIDSRAEPAILALVGKSLKQWV
jgi:uncharacterized protein